MNTARRNIGVGVVWVVGFWGPGFESGLWLGPHAHICMCESAFLLVTQWETLRCVCFLFYFISFFHYVVLFQIDL